MLLLTQERLMQVSERTIRERATSTEEIPRRICAELLSDSHRYSLWLARHERAMRPVAGVRSREQQILLLRTVSLQQIHRTALVEYLRSQSLTEAARGQTLREFYGVTDPRDSAVVEHRHYLIAASSKLCVAALLEMLGDTAGLELVERYARAYGDYFRLFCDRARGARNRQLFLLDPLIPEVRKEAERLRRRTLAGEGLSLQLVSAKLVGGGLREWTDTNSSGIGIRGTSGLTRR